MQISHDNSPPPSPYYNPYELQPQDKQNEINKPKC